MIILAKLDFLVRKIHMNTYNTHTIKFEETERFHLPIYEVIVKK